jgi:uncharacterized secreted protein with C-terminal beta-propeller domain
MRKSTMFISAVLTTFMLAIMFGVATAYQKIVQTGGSPTETAQTQPTDVMVAEPIIATSAATTTTITLEEAANLASSVIGRTDLYSSENTQLNGVDAYLVTFSSGDLVYVSLDGKILSITKLPVKYVLGQPVVQNNGGSSNKDNSGSSSNNEEHHDDGDDHEGDDD